MDEKKRASAKRKARARRNAVLAAAPPNKGKRRFAGAFTRVVLRGRRR